MIDDDNNYGKNDAKVGKTQLDTRKFKYEQKGKAKMRKIRFFYWIGHTTQWKMQQIKHKQLVM